MILISYSIIWTSNASKKNHAYVSLLFLNSLKTAYSLECLDNENVKKTLNNNNNKNL